MKEKLGFRYPSVTADSGYESEEGYEYLKWNRPEPPKRVRDGKRGVLRRISVNGKTWSIIRKLTLICHAGKKMTMDSRDFC